MESKKRQEISVSDIVIAVVYLGAFAYAGLMIFL